MSWIYRQVFIDRSRRYLTEEYFSKIARCLEKLSDEDTWWRATPVSNSVGNLLLHLAGNVRQWIISGVGGAPDVRQRQREFDAHTPLPPQELMAQLRRTLDEADAVLARLDPAQLSERCSIQGREVTVFEAIYHVVEHFSMHTGQIILVTKMRTGRDLGFYELQDGLPQPRWYKPQAGEG